MASVGVGISGGSDSPVICSGAARHVSEYLQALSRVALTQTFFWAAYCLSQEPGKRMPGLLSESKVGTGKETEIGGRAVGRSVSPKEGRRDSGEKWT